MTQRRHGLTFVDSKASNVKKIAVMASTVAFEFNKATLKLRRSLHISPRSSPETQRKSTAGRETDHDESPGSTQSTSRKSSKRNRQLCAELSSFALYPLFGALSPSHFSSPNLLFQNEKKPAKLIVEFLKLSDSDIRQIMGFLDPKSLLNMSQTCTRMRSLCLAHESNFEKRDVTSHEIFISFNQIRRRTEVRLLKKERTRNDAQFTSSKLRDILPPFSRALTKITFETTVFVTDWLDEILTLHTENRLIPLGLVFTGGALTKGNQLTGADLRSITENEFIDFVAKLQPHLQEVQLSTSRIFKMKTDPPRLLEMISMLSSFGIIYERPPLRFSYEEISAAVTFWRSDALSRSCDVYLRRPHDVSVDSWIKLSGEIEESRIDPYTDEVLVSRITVKHSFLVHIDLVFHFH